MYRSACGGQGRHQGEPVWFYGVIRICSVFEDRESGVLILYFFDGDIMRRVSYSFLAVYTVFRIQWDMNTIFTFAIVAKITIIITIIVTVT